MRTIDRATDSVSSPILPLLSGVVRGLRRLTSILPRMRYRGKHTNRLDELNEHCLRDLSLNEEHMFAEGRTRAERQDARLQEARRLALMLMMGTGGR
ncbi:hypothetical protein [Rhizobium oryzicola]|uniref:DUF1127 domain-containing protein n=1 Tax=Rhizobium oryzicola TaxID=1232668 RepID=A0ABT8ST95_9HYPH|nr:hypothetical protein [Rhizobium oryzicola]MDO1581621.1 hypothetical protein [Rhizobium oryzicola]